MKKYFLILLLINHPFLYGQWNWCSNTPQSTGNGLAIDAVGTQFVIFSSGSQLFKSTDGGADWEALHFPTQPTPYSENVLTISAVDTFHCWIGTTKGIILSTTDGGSSWNEQFKDTSLTEFVDYVKMFDLNNGIALCSPKPGMPALFLKTTNGGTTWTPRTSAELVDKFSGDTWKRVCFVDPDIGFFWPSLGSIYTVLLKTTNGGQSWTQTNYTGYAQVLRFYNESIGMVVDHLGKIWRTTDGGVQWDSASIPETGWGNDIEFDPTNPARVWMTNLQSLFYSSDTGRTWVEKTISFPHQFSGRDIVFTDSLHGWILGDGKNLFKTDNAGNVLSVPINTPSSKLISFGILRSYPNPFNPSTTIQYSLSQSSQVKLTIYNILGEKVRMLVNEYQGAGVQAAVWNAKDDRSMPVSSGIYFYRLEAGGKSSQKKMILMK